MYTVQMKIMMAKYVIGEKKNLPYSAKLTDKKTSVGQFCIRLISSDVEWYFTQIHFMPVKFYAFIIL